MWNIELTDIFEEWFNQQSELIQNRILAGLSILEMNGPNAGRPHVDSIHGSKYTNMKELRIGV